MKDRKLPSKDGARLLQAVYARQAEFHAQPGATDAPERRVGTANGICSGARDVVSAPGMSHGHRVL